MKVLTAPERIAPRRGSFFFAEHAARYRVARRLARGRRVLDLGCGTAYGSAYLARVAARVVALDRAPEVIALARCQYPRFNLAFLCGDARAIPFRDGAFALVCAFEMIEHVGDSEGVLAEVRRVLKRGGWLLVSTPNRRRYPMAGLNPHHAIEWEPEEFRALLERHFRRVACAGQACGAPVRRWAANAMALAGMRAARLLPDRVSRRLEASRRGTPPPRRQDAAGPFDDLDALSSRAFSFTRCGIDRADYVLAVCRR